MSILPDFLISMSAMSAGTSCRPVPDSSPEPGHLRRTGLSQSQPEPVPHRFLREYPPADLARQNGKLARARSVRLCSDRREIPCTKGANAAELDLFPHLLSEVCAACLVQNGPSIKRRQSRLTINMGRPGPPLAASGDGFVLARIGCDEATIIRKPRLDAISTMTSSTLSGRGGRPISNS
ncbi:hypothetical protein THAOC_06293, partial [Thalassiosira oceanica]